MSLKRIQLGLVHVAVAMTLVPINSTLNRVMIKELALSAALVGVLASLPYLFSPIQVAIGSFADRNPLLGWRRTPYIFAGLALCVVGVAVAPQVAFLMAEQPGLGLLAGALAFGAWGMGYNLATVSYFSLATELSGEQGRARTIAVMFIMMIVSIIATAVTLGNMLEVYTPETLQRAFWVVGAAAFTLGLLGLLGLEPRHPQDAPASENYTWRQMAAALTGNPQVRRFFIYLVLLFVAILGQDILLEPYGAQAFGLSVQATTRITAYWGMFFLIAMAAGGALERRLDRIRQARLGAWTGMAAFALIIASGLAGTPGLFYLGVVLLGTATGLSTVSNLSLMLDMTNPGQIGLYIGAWGMANAMARLVGNVLSGTARDLATYFSGNHTLGYMLVFGFELALLAFSLLLLAGVDVSLFRKDAQVQLSPLEKAALAGDIG
ncbi:MAG: BCD family MFS transporter [Chloroflexi bacterium]|nr:BCD family MFS transporter [Chloroflexota bacterium]